MEFKMHTGYFNGDFNIETSSDSGEMVLESLWEEDGRIVTDAGEFKVGKVNSPREIGDPYDFMRSQVIHHGLMAIEKHCVETGEVRIGYSKPFKRHLEVFKVIRGMYKNPSAPLQLYGFKEFNEKEFTFKMYGRQIAGSGLNAGDMAVNYTKILSNLTKEDVEFIKREVGPMGADIYTFKINF